MNIKPFDQYSYYPTLRTRNAELKGLANLDAERKERIIPLITLGKWPRNDDFLISANKANDAMSGGAFFIDLANDQRHHSSTSTTLLDSNDNYKNWQQFTHEFDNAIPVVQLANGSQRDIVQQARQIETKKTKLAIRIRDFQKDTPLAIAALSAIDDVENAIVFIDAQYIRPALPAYIVAVTNAINTIRLSVPDAIISVLSTSFPSARTSFIDATKSHGSIDNLDRVLHQSIGGSDIAIYGDHGSIHAVIYDDKGIMRWTPTIDYPLEVEWVFERGGVKNQLTNIDAYSEAAKVLVSTYPQISRSDIWGNVMINNAAQGDVFGASPQSWIAVRVNLHLARQIDFSCELPSTMDGDDHEYDEEYDDQA